LRRGKRILGYYVSDDDTRKRDCAARSLNSGACARTFPSTVHLHPTPPALDTATAKMADNNETEYVTLVSSDDFEFKILRSAACIAGTIKKALDPKCMSSFIDGWVDGVRWKER
jgi:hypothetical protein